ncbi:MAG: twin-arginine translocase TatA/TatE family subunit [Acidimicrobiales bacterium]
MHFGPAEIFGVDGIIILVVVVLVLFGSTQIPKLARSLGSAQKEFKKGLDEGASEDGDDTKAGAKQVTQAAPPAAMSPPPTPPAQPAVEVRADGSNGPSTP